MVRDRATELPSLGVRLTEGELRQGSYPGQDQAIAIVRRLPYLPSTSSVLSAAREFVEDGVIPIERPGDALHLAFATIHRIDYLLTWNYAHLANVDTQRRLSETNCRRGWRSPILVSPETIPRATLGQTIRRRADE